MEPISSQQRFIVNNLPKSRHLRLIPVIDLLHGVVVRGVAGRRDEYRPVVSRIVSSSEPLAVARAIREQFGFNELYVADLDAIQQGRPNWDIFQILIDNRFRLLVDSGVNDIENADRLIGLGAGLIVGLESCPEQGFLRTLFARHAAADVIFSLDLKSGRSLANPEDWGTADPFEIALAAIDAGVRRMIVLDLAQVGIGEGVNTLPLCRRLRERRPDLEIITGGGVRNIEDIDKIARTEAIDGLLVASAIHDGRLLPDDVRKFRT